MLLPVRIPDKPNNGSSNKSRDTPIHSKTRGFLITLQDGPPPPLGLAKEVRSQELERLPRFEETMVQAQAAFLQPGWESLGRGK